MLESSKPSSEEPVSRDTLTELLRTGARQLLAHALEAERADLLAQYADQQDAQGRAIVVGNGHHPEREIQTGLGPVPVQVPKVRSRQGPPVTFHSALVPPYVRKTATLEAAIPWLYLKGISTGEMQTALEALVGPEAKGLSASTVARLKQTWREEYQTWRQHRLDDDEWVDIWVDGIYSGLRADHQRLCALVVLGVTSQGEKRLLAIGDGAMGFWGALEEIYPTTRQQRCWVHKTRNVLNALPKSVQPKAKQALHAIWQAETKADAARAFDRFLTTYEAKYLKATACLEKDRETLLTFYAFPAAHWQSLRTTNPIESTFATIRHRTTRTKSCLTRDGMLHMMFKLGRCAEKTWRRLRGFKQLAQVMKGVQFTDGMEVTTEEPVAA